MPARKWGGVARRGAGNLNPETREEREERERRETRDRRGGSRRDNTSRKPPAGRRGAAPKRGEREQRDPRPAQRDARPPRREPREPSPPPPWEPEEWIQEPDEPVRKAAGKAVVRGTKGATKASAPKDRPRRKAPEDVSKQIGATVGKRHSAQVEQRLMEAARAFERERYKDADR